MPNEKQRGLKKQGRENCQSESVLARPARASVGPPLGPPWLDGPCTREKKGKNHPTHRVFPALPRKAKRLADRVELLFLFFEIK